MDSFIMTDEWIAGQRRIVPEKRELDATERELKQKQYEKYRDARHAPHFDAWFTEVFFDPWMVAVDVFISARRRLEQVAKEAVLGVYSFDPWDREFAEANVDLLLDEEDL